MHIRAILPDRFQKSGTKPARFAAFCALGPAASPQCLGKWSSMHRMQLALWADMCQMFCGYSCLESLDPSSFNTENVTSMSSMFLGCSSLQILKVGENTNKGKISEHTFSGIKRNGVLYYPQGCDYSEWLSDNYLGKYGWTGQVFESVFLFFMACLWNIITKFRVQNHDYEETVLCTDAPTRFEHSGV